jgi:hypothetical protein
MSNGKTHWRKIIPTRYVCADDLDGQTVTVLIRLIQSEKIQREGAKTEEKPVMYFASPSGKPSAKGMILNATNAKTLAEMYGPYVEDWISKPVALYPVEVRAFGETTMAVRMKRPVAKTPAQQAATATAHDDTALFADEDGEEVEDITDDTDEEDA